MVLVAPLADRRSSSYPGATAGCTRNTDLPAESTQTQQHAALAAAAAERQLAAHLGPLAACTQPPRQTPCPLPPAALCTAVVPAAPTAAGMDARWCCGAQARRQPRRRFFQQRKGGGAILARSPHIPVLPLEDLDPAHNYAACHLPYGSQGRGLCWPHPCGCRADSGTCSMVPQACVNSRLPQGQCPAPRRAYTLQGAHAASGPHGIPSAGAEWQR